jgi:hypothetical protein
MSTFIEQDCTITHKGQQFTAGGAWLADCTDGYRRGIVYADSLKAIVTTWHGEKIADATYGHVYQGNFCKMRTVSFIHDGIKYTGRYCPDWSQAIKVRSTKKLPPRPQPPSLADEHGAGVMYRSK